jgi:hypothetical protein
VKRQKKPWDSPSGAAGPQGVAATQEKHESGEGFFRE